MKLLLVHPVASSVPGQIFSLAFWQQDKGNAVLPVA
jgi:hypothetical protein